MKNPKDIFPVDEQQAEKIEDLRNTFKDNADFRAALEDYFHIYDDFAEMEEDEFNKCFEEYISDNGDVSDTDNTMYVPEDPENEYEPDELTSSRIGDIKDQFALGKIKEDEAINQLVKEGKGKRDAKKILEKWKENGVVTSSLDSVVKDAAEYFGTEPEKDNLVDADGIITQKDRQFLEDLIKDEDDVRAKIGMYSVTFDEKDIIENSVDFEEDNQKEETFGSGTSFVQINSEDDFDEYNVRLPEEYGYEDVQGMWWEVNGNEGISLKELINRTNDDEVIIVIDDDRLFFDTAYNYILDSDYELEDYGLNEDDFEDGKYVGE